MKTTIDIPDAVMEDALLYTGAKTKRDAVVKAVSEFNRQKKVAAIIRAAGTFPEFGKHTEAQQQADIQRQSGIVKAPRQRK